MISANWHWLALIGTSFVEELGEPMGTQTLPAHVLRGLTAGCRGTRGSTLPSFLASSKPCRSSAGLCSEAAAPLPKQAAALPPDRVTERGEQEAQLEQSPQPGTERTWPGS